MTDIQTCTEAKNNDESSNLKIDSAEINVTYNSPT